MAIKTQRRAIIIKECRALVKKNQPDKVSYRKPIFEKAIAKKSWYVKMGPPVIDVHSVM
jgi:hypothetical protein